MQHKISGADMSETPWFRSKPIWDYNLAMFKIENIKNCYHRHQVLILTGWEKRHDKSQMVDYFNTATGDMVHNLDDLEMAPRSMDKRPVGGF